MNNEKVNIIKDDQNDLIEEFQIFSTWEDKYSYIIELGEKLALYPFKYQTDEYKVEGCQSLVWLHVKFAQGLLNFQATSDAAIVRGLIAILLRIYNNRTPNEIMNTKPRFIAELKLNRYLSQNRSNGLYAMLSKINSYAIKYSDKK